HQLPARHPAGRVAGCPVPTAGRGALLFACLSLIAHEDGWPQGRATGHAVPLPAHARLLAVGHMASARARGELAVRLVPAGREPNTASVSSIGCGAASQLLVMTTCREAACES
ncbi:hypothetical protein Dimus_024210, partial [Dionaea muscipula]